MSTVIGLKCENEVWVASDGRFIDPDTHILQVGIYNKVIKNGKYLIGYVGEVRAGQLMMPKFFYPPEDILDFPLSIIKVLKKHGSLIVGNNEVKTCGCDYIIAYEDKLFELDCDFSLVEIDDYVAVGSGGDHALASLRTTEKMGMKPKERIKLALEVACSFVTTSSPPFFFQSTKDEK